VSGAGSDPTAGAARPPGDGSSDDRGGPQAAGDAPGGADLGGRPPSEPGPGAPEGRRRRRRRRSGDGAGADRRAERAPEAAQGAAEPLPARRADRPGGPPRGDGGPPASGPRPTRPYRGGASAAEAPRAPRAASGEPEAPAAPPGARSGSAPERGEEPPAARGRRRRRGRDAAEREAAERATAERGPAAETPAGGPHRDPRGPAAETPAGGPHRDPRGPEAGRRGRRPPGAGGDRARPDGSSSGGARSGPRPPDPGAGARQGAPRAAEVPPPRLEPRRPPPVDDEPDEQATEAPTTAWGTDDPGPAPSIALTADLPAEPPADDPDPLTHALLDAPAAALGVEVVAVAGVRFAPGGRIAWLNAGDAAYAVGERVIVDGERGPRLGTIAAAPARRALPAGDGRLRRVLRRAGERELRAEDTDDAGRAHALRVAKDRAAALRLPLKVFRVEVSGALGRGAKVTVYYTSDDRLDLRDLLRELSRELAARVELRQLGVRDEAKAVGGIGSCGLTLCCTTWLPDFVPVSIKMAKDQGMVLTPSKVSGQCGRLKCCLVYEQAGYAELRKGLPKLGKRVVGSRGEGRIVEVDVLRQRVRVSYGAGDTEVVPATEVRPLFPSGGGAPGGAGHAPAAAASHAADAADAGEGGERDDATDETDDTDDPARLPAAASGGAAATAGARGAAALGSPEDADPPDEPDDPFADVDAEPPPRVRGEGAADDD
jgi:cell fate regulator YaaT (PSP1 superfamily)